MRHTIGWIRGNRLSPVALLVLGAAVAAACLGGCHRPTGTLHELRPKYDKPLPPGQLALRKLTDPRDIPDFTPAFENTKRLAEAIDNSLNYLSKPSSKGFFPYGRITHADAIASLKAFARLTKSGMGPRRLNRAVRERFDVYISVGWDGLGTVLFTGYYTPIFNASRTRTSRFRYPLYAQPSDLVKSPDGTTLGRRGAGGRVTPYPDRRRIETSGMLAGRELFWLSDPFEVYIAHVQGSALLRIGGKIVTAAYAATNGHDYKSIGRPMIRDGRIAGDKMSLQAMIDYFAANPREVQRYTWLNPRFIFFRESGLSPRGCLNEPVISMRSIATDKTIFPRACLAMIATDLPRHNAGGIELARYRGFALDQDAGGAIRAPGRCDVYMGVGAKAGQLAGRTQQEGRLYYLFLRK